MLCGYHCIYYWKKGNYDIVYILISLGFMLETFYKYEIQNDKSVHVYAKNVRYLFLLWR